MDIIISIVSFIALLCFFAMFNNSKRILVNQKEMIKHLINNNALLNELIYFMKDQAKNKPENDF